MCVRGTETIACTVRQSHQPVIGDGLSILEA